ncbi:uncharacterized protein LOC109717547 [Ananas comosus]|uniref:Uncharacterized protein LOC109717547 n=1 Tax=Ananas comosus TaxID=4615 RepID=A0A6P5G168_ANACO|nr:uncharacterized protein LOC109717547 [Ananas comosus]
MGKNNKKEIANGAKLVAPSEGEKEFFLLLLSLSLAGFLRTVELRWTLVLVVDVVPRSRSSTLSTSCCCEEVGRVRLFAILDVVLILGATAADFCVDCRYFGSYATLEHRIATKLGSLDSGLREESTKPLLAGFGEERRVSSILDSADFG